MRAARRKAYIHVDPCRYERKQLYFGEKPIVILPHVFHRACLRNISYPDQVSDTIKTGRVYRFGKHGIKFVKRSPDGSIICVGEDLGASIIIKTIERGN